MPSILLFAAVEFVVVGNVVAVVVAAAAIADRCWKWSWQSVELAPNGCRSA